MKKLKVIIYARLGSVPLDSKNPFAVQTQLMEDYCKKNNLNIVGRYEEWPEKQSDLFRPQFQKLLDDLRRGIVKADILLCEFPYRLSRDFEQGMRMIEALRWYGVGLRFVGENSFQTYPSETLQDTSRYLFAAQDRDQRKQKVIDGMVHCKKNGGWCGRVPLGYKRVKRKDGIQIVPDSKAKYVKLAFQLKASTRLTDKQIVELLSKKKYKSTTKQLSKLFSNPFYCGEIQHSLLKDEVVPGKHPAIVPKSLFKKVNKTKPRKPGSKK